MKTVAVIGAGITGLTAAHCLKAKNIPVKLFEAAPRVGGVVQSLRRDGHLVEFGPNSILETSPVISDLVRDLGLEGRRMYSDPAAEKRFIVRGKKPVEMPASPLGFVGTALFSPWAKLRLLAEPFIPAAPAEAEESIAQFTCRRLGREFLDYAIDPLVAGIYAGNPKALSVSQAFPKLHALEQRYRSLLVGQVLGARERKRRGEVSKQEARKFSFDEGLQVLIDALRVRLEDKIETDCAIECLERRGAHWVARLPCGHAVDEGEFGAVLLALPAHKMAGLKIVDSASLNFAALGDVYYPPVASVVLGFKRAEVGHPLNGFGMLVPEKEGCHILGALFSSSLFPNRAPKDEVTITCYIGGARAPLLPSLPATALFEMAERDLSIILDIDGKPTFRHATVFRQAIPQYNLGFAVFRRLMSEIEDKAPGLFIAGHARDGISLSDSILSGHKAGLRISDFLANCRPAESQSLVA